MPESVIFGYGPGPYRLSILWVGQRYIIWYPDSRFLYVTIVEIDKSGDAVMVVEEISDLKPGPGRLPDPMTITDILLVPE